VENVQAELDQHLITDAAGHCVTCGEMEPCQPRGLAHLAFEMLNALPHRRPGAAVELVQSGMTPVRWFG
jgi:hypothetical protein